MIANVGQKKELPFSDLSISSDHYLMTTDSAFTREKILRVSEYDIVVQDDELADRLEQIPTHFRDIIMLKYFLGWTDREIGELYGQHGFTIRARRLTALKKLRMIYEKSDI